MILDVFVPADGAPHTIEPGSAIVGKQRAHQPHPDRTSVYYEGGLFYKMTTEQKFLHAAGRCTQEYPTIARASYRSDHLVYVGTYDTTTRALAITVNIPAYLAWMKED